MKNCIFFETERKKYKSVEVFNNIFKPSFFSNDTFKDGFVRYIHYQKSDFFNDMVIFKPTPEEMYSKEYELSFGILWHDINKKIPLIDCQTRIKTEIIWNRKRRSLYYYPLLLVDDTIVNDKPIMSGCFNNTAPTIYNIYKNERDNKLNLLTTGKFTTEEAVYNELFKQYLMKNYTEQLKENIIKTIEL